MKKNKRKIQNNRHPLIVLIIQQGSLLLPAVATLVVFGFGFRFLVIAQTFKPPETTAPDNGALNQGLDDLDAYLRKTTNPPIHQTVQSPLSFGFSYPGYTGASAYIGSNNAAITGIVGAENQPPLAEPFSAYGYVKGGATNYGVYGYATGLDSAGIVGETGNASGYAGQFLGQVKVQKDPGTAALGSVTVDSTVFARRLVAANDWPDPYYQLEGGKAIVANSSIRIAGRLNRGLYGIADDLDDIMYPVYGRSVQDNGVDLMFSGDVGDSYMKGFKIYLNSASGACAYGLSENGNGVVAEGGSANYTDGANGKLSDDFDSSAVARAAVYGKSNSWSAVFSGDLKLKDSADVFYLGSGGIDRSKLKQLLCWCKKRGNCNMVTFSCP